MAYKNQAFILLFTLFTVSFTIDPSHATECASSGGISVYWGHNAASDEGNLRQACETGNYNFVVIHYLRLYDDGSTPELDLLNHCVNPCLELESQIQYCQNQGIKVFLSIGELVTATSSSSSADVVNEVADYIYENFLSNQSGPLGTVTLDGIDFFGGVSEGTNIKWDELVRAINAFSTPEKKIYLSASPKCDDQDLGNAIKTGLFDYLWVQFFNRYGCEYYNGSTGPLFNSWNSWTSKVQANNLLFLGIPGSMDVAADSYIPPDVLKSEVLPYVKKTSNYGGVVVWNRYYDKKGNMSAQIKDSVPKACRCVCDEAVSRNFYGLLSQSL